MLIRWNDLEVEALAPQELTGRLRDMNALQRETRWTLKEIIELSKLEGPGLAQTVYLTLRSVGRLITYAKAEELLDEIEFVPTEAEAAAGEARLRAMLTGQDEPAAQQGQEIADPTSAPTDSGRGAEPPGEDEPQPASRPRRSRTGSKPRSVPA